MGTPQSSTDSDLTVHGFKVGQKSALPFQNRIYISFLFTKVTHSYGSAFKKIEKHNEQS